MSSGIFGKIAVFGMVMAAQAWAGEWTPGSRCGLTDYYGDNSWRDVGRGLVLNEMSATEIHALPSLTKQQLIITAKHEIYISTGRNPSGRFDSVDAVHYLRDNSEAGDLYVSSFRVRGKVFTQVRYYPGGNPVGMIFAVNSARGVATISDSDVLCLRQ